MFEDGEDLRDGYGLEDSNGKDTYDKKDKDIREIHFGDKVINKSTAYEGIRIGKVIRKIGRNEKQSELYQDSLELSDSVKGHSLEEV